MSPWRRSALTRAFLEDGLQDRSCLVVVLEQLEADGEGLLGALGGVAAAGEQGLGAVELSAELVDLVLEAGDPTVVVGGGVVGLGAALGQRRLQRAELAARGLLGLRERLLQLLDLPPRRLLGGGQRLRSAG